MPFSSLRDFIDHLESNGRLVRVSTPVSPALEITEIQTRLLAEGGPAVLFENVVDADGRKFDMPVLANLFGTTERVAWGMGREPHELREVGDALAFLRQPEPPGGWREAMDMLPMVKTVMAMKPKSTGHAPCQDHRPCALPGSGAAGRRYRSRPIAGPDLLAGRTGAADHLAAGGHQGAGEETRGRP
jgi:4-hydroxy-3-polyprenylbenzoate decarboxylase